MYSWELTLYFRTCLWELYCFVLKNWQKDPKAQKNCILMLFHSPVSQYMDSMNSEQYAMARIYMDQGGPWSMKKFF